MKFAEGDKSDAMVCESIDTLSSLLDAVDDLAIVKLDLEGRVLRWNSGARLLAGYSDEEILSCHVSLLYTPQDRDFRKPDLQLAEALWNGQVEDENWRVRKDGSRFWAKVKIKPLQDEWGTRIGFSKTMQDITDRQNEKEALVQTLERLAENEQKIHCLIHAIQDCSLFMLDAEGKISSWNKVAENITGYTHAEIMGRHFGLFFPKTNLPDQSPAAWLDRAEEEGRLSGRRWLVRKNGSRFLTEVSTTPVYDKEAWLQGFAQVIRIVGEATKNEGGQSHDPG